jgi:puromycin-sensitive aminopeptidase
MTTSSNPYRLDRTLVPSAYRIFITPNLDTASFTGRVEIDVDIAESVNEFTLNAIELELGAATVTTGGTGHRSVELTLDEKYETATFHFDETLPKGTAVVEIAFTGILNDQLHGFYRSTFTDPSGVKQTIATTQFENTDARRAFPCWDEPAFKATYQVNLTVPSHLAAYSNSPVSSTTDLGNGQRTVSFTPTMKMSTYLVAFIVGPFGETEAMDVDGVPLRIVYPLGNEALTSFALECGAHALRFFSEYFDIAYPGDKLDMVAIPDFAQGAMENLGCVTYRMPDLLIDPSTASLGERKRVAKVVMHEIAHMWFGDLVTMEWWEGIWLNEAFATFMEVLCQDSFRPEWKVWVSFSAERELALDIDGLHATRPIEYEVVSPEDTRGMFDRLTYEKGAGVLRMLEQYLGAETYRDGIRHYLRKHSYANTKTTDLWDALEEVSKQPVRDVMNTWILQGGYPIVTLDEGTLTQMPFAYGPTNGPSSIGSSWKIPVITRSLQGGPVSTTLLLDEPVTISDAAPVVVNAGGWGYFRSRYVGAALDGIAQHMNDLDELERATVLSDSWALLFSSQITWEAFLTTAKGLSLHDEPTPWGTVAQAMAFVYRALSGEQRERFAGTVREIFQPQWDRLGWDAKPSDGELTAQMRAVVLGALGTIGEDAAIQAEANKRFESNNMNGDLAASIMRVVANQDRPGDYEVFLDRYLNPTDPQSEQRYLRNLGSFNEERVVLDAVDKCFSVVRNQDASIVIGILSMSAGSGPAVWKHATARWDEALKKFPMNTLSYMTLGVRTFINDPAFADEVEKFHREHSLGGEQKSVQQSIERMRVGLTFASAMRDQI